MKSWSSYKKELSTLYMNYLEHKTESQRNKSLVQYISMLRKLAYRGYPEACYDLALCYDDFGPLKNSLKKEYYWTKKAAELGSVGACNNLAILYEGGKAVKPNLKKAKKWYLEGAKRGDSTAKENYKAFIKQYPEV